MFSWGIRVEDGIAIKGEIVNSNGKEVEKLHQALGLHIKYVE